MWKIIAKWDIIAFEKNEDNGYERAIRSPWVRLILKNSNWKYLITKEFREEQGWFDFRLPGGKVIDSLESYLNIRWDHHKTEKAVLEAAKIEAKEEAWIDEIKNLEIYHRSSCWATIEWDLYYTTWDIVSMSDQDLWWDEVIHGIGVWFYSEQQVLDMIHAWDMKEERSIAVLVKYFGK